MRQADSDRYLRFLSRYRIVGHQYGTHFMSPCCHFKFGGGPYIFGNSPHTHTHTHTHTHLYTTKIISPVPGGCFLLSIHYAVWIWFVVTRQRYFMFEGVLRNCNPKYPSAY